MKEGGEDPEVVTDCLLPDSVQRDGLGISAVPSGTTEGKERSLSSHLEENSNVLDLPSACDLAERFLPPHSSENISEELFCSVDTFPSPPAGVHMKSQLRELTQLGGQPREYQCRGDRDSCSFWQQHRPEWNCHDDMCNTTGNESDGQNSLPSAVPPGFSAEGSEKANVRCSPTAGLCEPTEPHNAALSWMCEDDRVEDTRIRKSLDGFYKMYCKKHPDRLDPTYEAASQCLSQKISELANQDGTKYVSRCLQMAQVVLNRDGCKIFPNHPTTPCFSKPAEGEVVLEERKRTPGLSDDVLQFLMKQTQTEHSPDLPHEK